MKPGDLVEITRFGEPFIGLYVGLTPVNEGIQLYRFLIEGVIRDIDIEDKVIYRGPRVISEVG